MLHECSFNLDGVCGGCGRTTTSTLNGKWPTDTWFRRAMARKLKADSAELEQKASNELRKV